MRAVARGHESGMAVVEVGLLGVAVLVLVAALVQYGALFWSTKAASDSAYRSAESLVLGADWRCIHDRAVASARGAALGGDPTTVDRRYHRSDGAPLKGPEQGQLVTVTVSVPTFDLGFPLLPLPDGGRATRSVTARVENVPPVPLPCF
jgi:hypothetical protein